MNRLHAIVLFCSVVLLPIRAWTQGANATVSGVVLDPVGAVIPNAQIASENTKTGVVQTATTNEAGVYVFPSLQPGLYKLTANAENFRTYILNDVTLEVGARININFSLVLVGNTESVNVTAQPETPILTGTASVGSVINGQKI